MSEQRFTDELQQLLARSTEPQELLAWCLGWLSGSIRFKGGSIARLNGTDELEIVAAFGQIDEAARKVRLARGEGIAGAVVATGQAIYRPTSTSWCQMAHRWPDGAWGRTALSARTSARR